MAENKHADIWQKDIPTGTPFEIELREPSPKTIPMSRGGAFDKWKAGIPKSNPLHQGGDHEIEFVWFEVVSNTLKDTLRAQGQGRVTITKTMEGDKEKFEITDGWSGSAGATGVGVKASVGNGGRPGRPLPEGETAAQFLAGLCRATAFAHNYLRDTTSVAAAMLALAGDEGRSSFESTIFIQAGKLAITASIAALDSGQNLNAQLCEHNAGARRGGSGQPEIPNPIGGDEPPIYDEGGGADGELPF